MAEKILDFIMGGAAQEDFLDQDFENTKDEQSGNGGNPHMDDRLFETCGTDEKRVPPCLPEVGDDGDHRARVKHDQEECHGGAGRIESDELLSHDDMRGAGDRKKFGGSLDKTEEEDLEESRFCDHD